MPRPTHIVPTLAAASVMSALRAAARTPGQPAALLEARRNKEPKLKLGFIGNATYDTGNQQ